MRSSSGTRVASATCTSADECHPRWDTSLNVDYDVEKAKQLLQDAGYGDGFEFPVWIPTMNDTFVEVSEAMLEFWKEIGLTPVVQKTAYTARRPLDHLQEDE